MDTIRVERTEEGGLKISFPSGISMVFSRTAALTFLEEVRRVMQDGPYR